MDVSLYSAVGQAGPALQQHEAACERACQLIQQATTLTEVLDAARVAMPQELRTHSRAIQVLHNMRREAEAVLSRMLAGQLDELRAAPSAEDGRQRMRQMHQTHWQHLRAEFAALYGRTYALAQEIVAGKSAPRALV